VGSQAPRSGGSYRPLGSRGAVDHRLHPVVAARLIPNLWRSQFAFARLQTARRGHPPDPAVGVPPLPAARVPV